MDQFPQCETLFLEKQGPALFVTINRPDARNSVNHEVCDGLNE